jgi:4-amino-4-deoxy-L-arabinose transferase-like glycosyltransferase
MTGERAARRLDQLTWGVLLAALLLGLCVLPDYGATSDEAMRAHHGESWLRYFSTFDRRHLPQGHFAYYGALFDILGAALQRLHARWLGGADDLVARHLLVLLAGWLGLIGACRLSARLGPQPLPLLTVLLLLLLPRFAGSCFSYPKDIPFAAAFTWAAWGLLRWLDEPDERAALAFGLCTALCTAVRPFGAAFVLLGVLAWLWRVHLGPRRTQRQVYALFLYVLSSAALSALLWPTTWFHPPGHAIEGALALLQHTDGTPTLLFGRTYPFSAVPPGYMAVWLAITLPLPTLLLAALGLVSLVRGALRPGPTPGPGPRRLLRLSPALLLGGWALGPPLLPFFYPVVLYHTTRQFLFVMPAYAILAAVGLHATLRALHARRGLWLAALSLVACAYLDVALDMVRLHPYQDVYFSRLIGRVPGAVGRFTVSYNGSTYREAMSALAKVAGGPARVLVREGYISISVPRRYADEHGHTLNPPDFDYFITEHAEEAGARFQGEVVHRVRRLGVDLSAIVRVTPHRRHLFTWEPGRGPLVLRLRSGRAQAAALHLGYLGAMSMRVDDGPLRDLRPHLHLEAPAQEQITLQLEAGEQRLIFYADGAPAGERRLHLHHAVDDLEIEAQAPAAGPPGKSGSGRTLGEAKK